ncbi:hypothetical protein D3C87_2037180 [compost metagenome]
MGGLAERRALRAEIGAPAFPCLRRSHESGQSVFLLGALVETVQPGIGDGLGNIFAVKRVEIEAD